MKIDINTIPFFSVIALLTAIAATVLLFIFVLPAKKREGLPKLLKVIHDVFNMKDLLLESILRVLYVFSSLACVFWGVFMIFGFQIYDSGRYSYTNWAGGYGILVAILGPIALRIAFELVMMFVLLVKNTIQINKKLKDQNEE